MTVDNIEEREEAARLWAQAYEARVRYADHPVSLLVDDDGEVRRCAKTSIPIVEDDEVVEDLDTGEIWLRSAVGLPPRDAVVDDEAAEEAA